MLTATVVLISQRRQTKLSEQRVHLDLQINLLTEQKVTKLIHLIEELRRDFPWCAIARIPTRLPSESTPTRRRCSQRSRIPEWREDNPAAQGSEGADAAVMLSVRAPRRPRPV